MTKEDILTMLLQAEGTPRSGEQMADTLGMSRTAVWKAIERLREEGHTITAKPHQGYVLEAGGDVLTRAGVVAALPPDLREIPLHVTEEIASTNQTAKKMAIDGACHGTVVVADHQTAGRGRYGRAFYSPPGSGLYLSVVLRDAAYLATPTQMTAAVAVLVAEAIQQCTGIFLQIKWVNDLLCPRFGRKVCGILTEAVTSMENKTVDFLVVGIGINVHPVSFPPELTSVATSLAEALAAATADAALEWAESGELQVTRSQLAGEILQRMLTDASWITAASTYEQYRGRLGLLGKQVTVVDARGSYEAKAVGLTPDYHLEVLRPNGERVTLSSGEVSVR